MIQPKQHRTDIKIVKSERVGRLVINTIQRDYGRQVFEARTTNGDLVFSGVTRAKTIRVAQSLVTSLGAFCAPMKI